MALTFDKQKQSRIKSSQFTGMFCLESNWWYNTTLKKWEDYNNTRWESGDGHANVEHIKSVRAFRRKLKSIPKGVRFTLKSWYVGFDVHGCGGKSLS
jgi:hypothetical protein